MSEPENTLSGQFNDGGFAIIRQLMPREQAHKLYQDLLLEHEKGNFDDGQVPGSASFYQHDKVVSLRNQLKPIIEQKIGLKLWSVFCYHRIYRKNAVLRMHKDTHRAEISATINLGQADETPWDISLVDYQEQTQVVTLYPGDALVYWGSRLFHWRARLTHTDWVAQAMFHFVDARGKHRLSVLLEWFPKLRKKWRKLCGKVY